MRIGDHVQEVETPALLLDLAVAEWNIVRLQAMISLLLAPSISRTAEFRFDLFDGRQGSLEIVRQDLDQAGLPVGDAQGLGEVAQGVLHDHPVLALAEQQADGGRVVGVAHQVVHGREVQVHVADEGGAERHRLELDDDVPAELEVVEQQVHAEVAIADLEEHLPADEGESGPHLQQEALDV